MTFGENKNIFKKTSKKAKKTKIPVIEKNYSKNLS